MCHWRHVTCDIHLEGDIWRDSFGGRKYIIAIIQSECMISTGGITTNIIIKAMQVMSYITSLSFARKVIRLTPQSKLTDLSISNLKLIHYIKHLATRTVRVSFLVYSVAVPGTVLIFGTGTVLTPGRGTVLIPLLPVLFHSVLT